MAAIHEQRLPRIRVKSSRTTLVTFDLDLQGSGYMLKPEVQQEVVEARRVYSRELGRHRPRWFGDAGALGFRVVVREEDVDVWGRFLRRLVSDPASFAPVNRKEPCR